MHEEDKPEMRKFIRDALVEAITKKVVPETRKRDWCPGCVTAAFTREAAELTIAMYHALIDSVKSEEEK